MASSRTEKHTAVYRNVKRCEFHNIGDYIVVTSIIGGTTFCAFFDSGLHTEESIKGVEVLSYIPFMQNIKTGGQGTMNAVDHNNVVIFDNRGFPHYVQIRKTKGYRRGPGSIQNRG